MPPNIYVPTYMPIYNELDSRQRLLLKLKFRVALISPFNKASNVIFPPTITLYNLQQYLLLWINDLIKLLKIITLFFKKINIHKSFGNINFCIYVNGVKQTFIKKCSTIEFIIGAIAPVLTKIYKINFIHFCKF